MTNPTGKPEAPKGVELRLKISLNDYCPCGSGKKFRNCHYGKEGELRVNESRHSVPRARLDDLDPAKADVMSPEYWTKMSKRLPPGMRKELGPMLAEVKQYAELEARREKIDAALEILEAHRDEYVELVKDPTAFMRRAEQLFGEEPFAGMRFHAADIHRAFEAVGYPAPGYMDQAFVKHVGKALGFLLDDAQRKTLARRLLLPLPDYVGAGRYLDGWIIEHSADVILDQPEGVVSPFLLAMFLHGLREWESRREEEQEAMFKTLGLSAAEISRLGYDGVEARLRALSSSADGMAAAEEFLDSHPELKAMSYAQCVASEQAALELLRGEEAEGLLLDPEEVEPWLRVLESRIQAAPQRFASLTPARPPDKATAQAFAALVYDLAAEMAKVVFTPSRLDRLRSQLHDLRRRFSAEDDPKVLDGVHGAIAAVQPTATPEDSRFLVSVCWMSLRAVIEDMAGPGAGRS